jgi:hypothetical protein
MLGRHTCARLHVGRLAAQLHQLRPLLVQRALPRGLDRVHALVGLAVFEERVCNHGEGEHVHLRADRVRDRVSAALHGPPQGRLVLLPQGPALSRAAARRCARQGRARHGAAGAGSPPRSRALTGAGRARSVRRGSQAVLAHRSTPVRGPASAGGQRGAACADGARLEVVALVSEDLRRHIPAGPARGISGGRVSDRTGQSDSAQGITSASPARELARAGHQRPSHNMVLKQHCSQRSQPVRPVAYFVLHSIYQREPSLW